MIPSSPARPHDQSRTNLTHLNPPIPKLKCEKCGKEFEPKPRAKTGPAPENRFCSRKHATNFYSDAYRARNKPLFAARKRTIFKIGGMVEARMDELADRERFKQRAIREIAAKMGLSVEEVARRVEQHRNRLKTIQKTQARPEHKQTLKTRRILVKKAEAGELVEAKELAALHAQVEAGKAAEARIEEIRKAPGPVLIGENRLVMKKPGPKLDLERAAFVYELREVERLQWDAIVQRVEARFHTQTTDKALQELLRRYRKYLALQEKPTG
jgi:hypothetical protein